MLSTFPKFTPPREHLRRLADTPFDPPAFRAACESFATFLAEHSSDDQWRFTFDDSAVAMVVMVETERMGTKPNGWPLCRPLRVLNAILSLCWWEDFSDCDHELPESFQDDRKAFDQLFSDELRKATVAFGAPLLQGRDTDNDGLQHALWRGTTGLLVLQQSAYDPQFGLDINYWLTPWSGKDPQPTSPFIDWLTAAHLLPRPGTR